MDGNIELGSIINIRNIAILEAITQRKNNYAITILAPILLRPIWTKININALCAKGNIKLKITNIAIKKRKYKE